MYECAHDVFGMYVIIARPSVRLCGMEDRIGNLGQVQITMDPILFLGITRPPTLQSDYTSANSVMSRRAPEARMRKIHHFQEQHHHAPRAKQVGSLLDVEPARVQARRSRKVGNK